MSTVTANPPALPAPGFLDLRPTLRPGAETAPVGPRLPPLDYLLLAARLSKLYALVFPDESAGLDEAVSAWANEEDVAEAVGRFLARVGQMFPVYEEVWEVDLESIEWRLYEIPVVPLGYDEWHDEWEAFKEPAPYLLYLSYARHDDDAADGRSEFAALYPDHLVPRHLEPHRLVARLRALALPEPLDALPDLIEMLAHHTGNWWLDTGEMALAESGGHPPWTTENVAWLAAQPVAERVQRLLDWQEGTPAEVADKLMAVREALLSGEREREEEEEEEKEGQDG